MCIRDSRMKRALEIMRSSALTPLKTPVKSMGGLIGGEAKKLAQHAAKGLSLIHICTASICASCVRSTGISSTLKPCSSAACTSASDCASRRSSSAAVVTMPSTCLLYTSGVRALGDDILRCVIQPYDQLVAFRTLCSRICVNLLVLLCGQLGGVAVSYTHLLSGMCGNASSISTVSHAARVAAHSCGYSR